jgi:hypothetical protein
LMQLEASEAFYAFYDEFDQENNAELRRDVKNVMG